MPASYTIRRSVPRNTRRSKPASTPSTCFPSFSINLFMAFPLPRGDLSSNTTNIIREQETPSPFGCGYAALWYPDLTEVWPETRARPNYPDSSGCKITVHVQNQIRQISDVCAYGAAGPCRHNGRIRHHTAVKRV